MRLLPLCRAPKHSTLSHVEVLQQQHKATNLSSVGAVGRACAWVCVLVLVWVVVLVRGRALAQAAGKHNHAARAARACAVLVIQPFLALLLEAL